MRKSLLGLFILALLFAPALLNGANAILGFKAVECDSLYWFKYQTHYTVYACDTHTFKYKTAATSDTTWLLGSMYNCFVFRSLNAAGDSGSVIINFGNAIKGFYHADTIAWKYDNLAVGLNSADTYLICPIGADRITFRPVIGGNADSTATIEVQAWR